MTGQMTMTVKEPEVPAGTVPIAADAAPVQGQAQAVIEPLQTVAPVIEAPDVTPVVSQGTTQDVTPVVSQAVIEQAEAAVVAEDNQKLAAMQESFTAQLKAQEDSFKAQIEQLTSRKGVAQTQGTPYQQPQVQEPQTIDINAMNPFEVNKFDQSQNIEAGQIFKNQFSKF